MTDRSQPARHRVALHISVVPSMIASARSRPCMARGGARLAAESHAAAIDRIETIVREEGIECSFERVDGFLFAGLPPTASPSDLHVELEAAHRAGLHDVQLLRACPIASLGVDHPCLRFPRQAQFHPLRYVSALARLVRRRGANIYAPCHAREIDGGDRPKVTTGSNFTIRCAAVIVATNAPINSRFAIHTKQSAYRTYVIAAAVPAGSLHKALYWDTEDPYHYIRIVNSHEQHESDLLINDFLISDLLIVGGEDHKTGQKDDAEARYHRLETWMRERFPTAGSITMRWSGQVMEPVDGLAFIGESPDKAKNVYIITGDSGNGLTHGTLGAMLVTDLITGRSNPWAALYDPSRTPVRAIKEFARENVNTLAHYGQWLSKGDVEREQVIEPGNGAVIRDGIHKLAVFRDESGALHRHSAVCTHLGCVVRWNSAERSWDCPCHGSRFDALGHVINGPANRDLEPARVPRVEPGRFRRVGRA